MTLVSTVSGLLPDSLFVKAIAHAHRRFEPELARIVASCPQPGTALDVGAWYGPWTYWLARRVERVVSFEPNPYVARVLEQTVASNVTVHRAAASDTTGTAVLALPSGGRGTEGRASLEGLADSSRTVQVETCRLDDLALSDVTLIKVDVEGHELAALSGAEKIVETSRPVLVVEIEERHGGIAKTVDLLESWDYRGHVLVDGAWTSLDDFDLAAYQQEYLAEASSSYLTIVVRRKGRYINNVVFTHPLTPWKVD